MWNKLAMEWFCITAISVLVCSLNMNADIAYCDNLQQALRSYEGNIADQ